MSPISRTLNIIKNHRVFFITWVFLPVYHLLIANHANWFHVNEITYAFYAVDYSMGFCSRLLPGAVYHFLIGIYNKRAVEIYLTFLYLLLVLIVAYLAEKFVNAFPENQKECMILALLFLTGPFTFAMFIVEFGMLDFYWAFLFFISCLLLQHKYLRFLIPVCVALMILTHYGGLICYVAALLLIILFFVAKATTRHEQVANLVLFGLSLFVGVGLTLYFMFNDSNNLVFSLEEFDKIIGGERNAYPTYYDIYFYKYIPDSLSIQIPPSDVGMSGFEIQNPQDLFDAVFSQIKATFATLTVYINKKLFFANIVGLIPQVFLFYVLFSYLKDTKRFKRMLTGLMALLAIFIEVTGIIFSTDNTRWLGHSIIILFVFVFYILYFDYKEGMKKIQALFSKTGYWFVYVVLFFHANMVVDPYTLK